MIGLCFSRHWLIPPLDGPVPGDAYTGKGVEAEEGKYSRAQVRTRSAFCMDAYCSLEQNDGYVGKGDAGDYRVEYRAGSTHVCEKAFRGHSDLLCAVFLFRFYNLAV